MRIIELKSRPERLYYGTVVHPLAGECTVAWYEDSTIAQPVLVALYVAVGRRAEVELERIWGSEQVERRPDFDPFSDDITLALYGTELQKRVWRTLLTLPAGKTISYGELALLAGYPKAVRAVASAVARNEIGVVIPCHLIIRSTGDTGQYRWGPEIKKIFLGRA